MTDNNRQNAPINWYPGHMEKARRDMKDALKAVDIIIEVRDARIPYASSNPMLNELAGNKPRLIILGKSDLADPNITDLFIRSWDDIQTKGIAMDIAHDKNVKTWVIQSANELGKPILDKWVKKGIKPRPLRAMACGIPNAGKSTLINRIAGKKSAKTEDRPGVTRSLTWIKASNTLEILDTPGVLWPKFEDQKTGSLLAAMGAINEDILDIKDIAMDTMHTIRELYPNVLENAYRLPDNTRIDTMLNEIAIARHLLKENNTPDMDRAAITFLHELRKGKLGRLTLERPYETTENLSQ